MTQFSFLPRTVMIVRSDEALRLSVVSVGADREHRYEIGAFWSRSQLDDGLMASSLRFKEEAIVIDLAKPTLCQLPLSEVVKVAKCLVTAGLTFSSSSHMSGDV